MIDVMNAKIAQMRVQLRRAVEKRRGLLAEQEGKFAEEIMKFNDRW